MQGIPYLLKDLPVNPCRYEQIWDYLRRQGIRDENFVHETLSALKRFGRVVEEGGIYTFIPPSLALSDHWDRADISHLPFDREMSTS